MIEEGKALSRILDAVQSLPARTVALDDALDGFSAREIMATVSLPPFANSAMDGYAVVASSCEPGARLRLVGEQPAGVDQRLRIRSGEAIRIFTGAPLPAGADAVVMQEETSVDGASVLLTGSVEPGEFVRPRGGDVAAGQKILSAGERIHPETLALLASQGLLDVEIRERARVAVISTGDELTLPGTPLQPGQIYESNAKLVAALARTHGAEVAMVRHCRDEAPAIEAAVREAIGFDVLIISGGVSVGARDLVKPTLAAVGASLDLWRVAVKPGKPFLFGRAGGCLVFGLPGNPVSAYVTFLLFVRPAILKLMGAGPEALRPMRLRAATTAAIANDGDRPHYIRGTLEDGRFSPTGRQESHALFGLSRSNALLRAAPGERLAAGASADVFIWR